MKHDLLLRYRVGREGELAAECSTIVEAAQDAKVSYLTNDHLGSPRINTDASAAAARPVSTAFNIPNTCLSLNFDRFIPSLLSYLISKAENSTYQWYHSRGGLQFSNRGN
ncbi:MAG: hypothetical protein UZ17_ACD001002474 [Acidobacteria bacterium OLB17]|nr:MAG: hypothetical protein UZ17_ACD001002474 [Acidobacteria bacterium OLB17]